MLTSNLNKCIVGTLGSPESLADDITNLLLTDESIEGRLSIIIKDCITDLYAMQELIEAISKYSYGKCSQDRVIEAFNKYRSNLHFAKVLEQ
jgi:hypothetical protein